MEAAACPLCGATEERFLFWARDRMHHVEGTFRVVQCRRCTMVYLTPRPTREGMARYYPSEAYYSYHPSSPRSGTGLARAVKDLLKAAIAGVHLGYDQGPAPAVSQRKWLRAVIWLLTAPIRDRLCQYLPPAAWGKRILDVGCGAGLALDYAREFGWQTYGIDVDEAAVARARARGHEARVGEVGDLPYSSEFFDVVRIWHTLEHLPHPLVTLREVHRVLKPGGRLWLEVPNIGSAAAAVFRSRWFALDAPRHLQSFSPRTLERMLREAGFGEVALKTYQGAEELTNSMWYVLEDIGLRLKGRCRGALMTLSPMVWKLPSLAVTSLRLGDRLRATAVKRTEPVTPSAERGTS